MVAKIADVVAEVSTMKKVVTEITAVEKAEATTVVAKEHL